MGAPKNTRKKTGAKSKAARKATSSSKKKKDTAKRGTTGKKNAAMAAKKKTVGTKKKAAAKKTAAKKKAVVKKKTAAKKKAVVKKKTTVKKKAVVKKKTTVKKKVAAKKKAVVKKKVAAKKKPAAKKKITAKKKAPAKKTLKKAAPKKTVKKKSTGKKTAPKRTVKKAAEKKAAPKKVMKKSKVQKQAEPVAAVRKQRKGVIKIEGRTEAQVRKELKKYAQKLFSEKDLQHFRDLILDKIQEAREELRSIEERIIDNDSGLQNTEDSTYSMHMADQGTDAMEREKAFLFVSRERKFIGYLEEALQRVRLKTYGICKICGLQLPRERLEAVPHTEICTEYKNTKKPCERGQKRLELLQILEEIRKAKEAAGQ
ncbi:MAG: hypothetical protein GXO82_10495 [Chlorobi bacterium]|nr:hypothetical protein [Chlorobiota bacterium]